jgi:NTE family protein
MLQKLTAGVSRLLGTGSRTKKINLALQGGGSHGAFTWGVLDQILDDGRVSIAGISGTSAGALNAVMVADGLARGGPQEARKRLAEFWRAASRDGSLPGPQRAVFERWLSFFPMDGSPFQVFVDAISHYFSPYDFNPLNINPLKDLIERFVDFKALQTADDFQLFVSATNVRTGRLKIFPREKITADVVMASAALPLVFRAVEIDGDPYWDGGYVGNPAIFPLLHARDTEDLLLVQINPLVRDKTPTSAQEILYRINEITFNSSLSAELRALEYIGRLAGSAGSGRTDFPCVNVHRITLGATGKKLTAGSRLNNDYDFFELLHRAGRRAARRFLENHFDDIGVRSTIDLAAETAVERA